MFVSIFTDIIEGTFTSLWAAISFARTAAGLSALANCLDLLSLLPVDVEDSMILEKRAS